MYSKTRKSPVFVHIFLFYYIYSNFPCSFKESWHPSFFNTIFQDAQGMSSSFQVRFFLFLIVHCLLLSWTHLSYINEKGIRVGTRRRRSGRDGHKKKMVVGFPDCHHGNVRNSFELPDLRPVWSQSGPNDRIGPEWWPIDSRTGRSGPVFKTLINTLCKCFQSIFTFLSFLSFWIFFPLISPKQVNFLWDSHVSL